MFYMQLKWLQKLEVDRGVAYSKQESRSYLRGLVGGSGDVSVKNGGRSRSQGEEEDFCRSEREEQTVDVSDMGVVGLSLG